MPDYNFEHVHLISENPLKSAEFYVKYLGAVQESVMNMPGGAKAVRLKIKDSLIIISPPRVSPPVFGLDHFGLTTDNMQASVAELKAAGCTFRGEPVELFPGTNIAFFWTPERVLVELVEEKNKKPEAKP
ncbi:MAG TPA: VOC family protein [Dehalococcoidales bacterium]|nr:VOC family protein [Dehalococcoidales bacterium]